MLPLLTLLQLLDIWTTHKCLSRQGTVESNPILAKLFTKLGILPTLILMKGSYITLPPFGIFVLAERINDLRLRRHEECHWKQYQRMGFWGFYLKYLWYSARYGYRNNPLEIEAREYERQ